MSVSTLQSRLKIQTVATSQFVTCDSLVMWFSTLYVKKKYTKFYRLVGFSEGHLKISKCQNFTITCISEKCRLLQWTHSKFKLKCKILRRVLFILFLNVIYNNIQSFIFIFFSNAIYDNIQSFILSLLHKSSI